MKNVGSEQGKIWESSVSFVRNLKTFGGRIAPLLYMSGLR